MNREGWIMDHESSLEGCYHEMGHVLATIHYFPNEDRVKSISCTMQQNGTFRFDTNFNEYQWSFPSQKEALIMICIGGGVFQQMKKLYSKLKQNPDFADLSDIKYQNALKSYFLKYVQCPYDGMEDDLYYLYHMFDLFAQHGFVSTELDLNKEKTKAIDLFMPYLENKKIDELCEHIVDKIMANGGACDTIIGMDKIREYLGE